MDEHLIIHALTGACLCIVPAASCNQDAALDVYQISVLAKHDLRGYCMIRDGSDELMDLNIDLECSSVTNVIRRNPADVLENRRMTVTSETAPYHMPNEVPPGWRRWYKEFKIFASSVAMLPGESEFLQNPGDYSLGREGRAVPIRRLVPLILQFQACDYRDENNTKHEAYPGRTLAGAKHSIMRQSGLCLADVEAWIESWLEANKDITDAVHNALVKDDPFTFFA